MALTFNGTNSGLARSGSIVSNYPFTIFAWTRATAAQAGFVAEVAADPGPSGGHEGHGALSNGSWMRAWSSTGNPCSAYSDRLISVGDWVPCMVVFASTSLRKVYYGNGAVQVDTNTSPQVPSALNMFVVGRMAVKDALYWKGDLACVGLWSTELTAADYAQLAAGAVPSTVRASSIIDYWPLLTQAATQVGLNGRVLAATNTAQAASHPITETSTGGADTTPPTLTGAITVSALTSTSYTLAWPAGADNVAIVSYDLSLDSGLNWTNVGNVLVANITGRVPGGTDPVRVRARDAAGNVSSPPLGTSVTLLPPPDTTAPVLTGSIVVSALTSTSYTVAWPAASDNVAVSAYEVSVDGGLNWTNVGIALAANISGRVPGSTDPVRVRARDAAGNVSTPPLGTSVTLLPLADTTPPVLTGPIVVSAITSTSYTLGWPAGTDNVAVTGYERSLDGGATWVDVGNVLSVGITGRTPASTDQVRIRARDAAGNVSTPPLSTAVTLASSGGSGSAVITTPPLKNNTGTLLANLTDVSVNVYNASTGVLVVRKTGLVSDAFGIVRISDAALAAGTVYAYEVVTPSNGRRLPLGTAT